MDTSWIHPEKDQVILVQQELGDLVVDVEAKNVGGGQIMSQIELRSTRGPLRRHGHPHNNSSFTKHFRYSRSKNQITGTDEGNMTAASPMQVANWIVTTAIVNYEGLMPLSRVDRLHCEKKDGGRDERLTKAYTDDAKGILDSVLGCCISIHITNMSITYNAHVSRRISTEKVRECWDRRILLEVMES